MTDLIKNPFKSIASAPFVANTLEDVLLRGGFHAEKTITLDANNTTDRENIFQVTGSVQVLAITGVVADATTLTNCTDVSLQTYDGTAAVQITGASGASISGFNVGGALVKNSAAANAITTSNNDQTRVIEASIPEANYGFYVQQKTGQNTFIRMQYTTSDAPINAQIEWHCVWRPGPDNAGSLVAV